MSTERSAPREVIAHVSLAALGVGVLAMGGCTSNEKHSVTHAIPTLSPTPSATASPTRLCTSALEQFTIALNLKVGGAYAINGDDCVNVYAEEVADATEPMGEIPADARFYISCYDLTTASLRVTVGRLKGRVDVTEYAVQQLDEDPSAQNIRTC